MTTCRTTLPTSPGEYINPGNFVVVSATPLPIAPEGAPQGSKEVFAVRVKATEAHKTFLAFGYHGDNGTFCLSDCTLLMVSEGTESTEMDEAEFPHSADGDRQASTYLTAGATAAEKTLIADFIEVTTRKAVKISPDRPRRRDRRLAGLPGNPETTS